jgi:tRNA modification GTPase
MHLSDTIVAISSAVGAAARMIVRLAGPRAFELASMLTTDSLAPSAATRTRLRILDLPAVPATVYAFRAPRSYTGDDLVEFHLPGNPLLARLLLDHLARAGARPAEPGEFTARAYFNGRLDLAEAEGVAATVAANDERELAAARQLLAGELSRRLKPALESIARTLALVEAGIDFADEDVEFICHADVLEQVAGVDATLAGLLAESGRFEALAHEPVVALVGRPNAGKSTLLNALAGRARAVVSPLAGTTRDALSAEVLLPGGRVRLVDLAGLGGADDPASSGPLADVERRMSEQALRRIEEADVVVLVCDVTDIRPPIQTPREPHLIVRTKTDLIPNGSASPAGDPAVSAATGAGLNALRVALSNAAFGRAAGSATLALNARHVACVDETRHALAAARAVAESHGPAEFIAHHLRDALDALGQVLGAVTPDDVLGRVFAAFCIGK